MKTNKSLEVYYDEKLVGKLAMTGNAKGAFEYSDEWIENGFSISPFSLPLEKRVFVPSKPHFGGLFGVFADSLPDAWGNILLNRVIRKNGFQPDQLNVLDRLAIVGNSGMGALSYKPEMIVGKEKDIEDLDILAGECKKILQSEYSDKLDELYRLGGTSGGARPKIMTCIDGEEWIIKFPAHVDGKDSGKMEYDYSLCAKKCGIEMTETKIFESKECKGYFGTKRFDRLKVHNGSKRVHMITAAALLEVDFNQPSLDYHSLMKLTKIMTGNNKKDVENMFRRMCFNVFAHNRDDHSKNFSYIYDEESGMWRLSPAYDLTYSSTYYGEHTTAVNGNGSNPGEKDLLQVGMTAGISRQKCCQMIEEVKGNVEAMLGEYLS
jgi:serine/threonine-protein kinase HipA